jgi:predicted RNA polymerase sigma factor
VQFMLLIYEDESVVRADLLRRTGRNTEALHAYEAAIRLVTTSAERLWLTEKRDTLADRKD